MGGAASGEIVVKRRPEAVSEVRGFVRLELGRWGLDDQVACLVASELTTNAVRYGGAADEDLVVRLSRTDDGALWLEVQDGSPEAPCLREAGEDEECGRGLFLVDRLARHWGVRPLSGHKGKVVFAVLEV